MGLQGFVSLAQPLLRAYQEQSSLAGAGTGEGGGVGVGGGGGGGGGHSADGRRDVLQEEAVGGGGGNDANTLAFQSLVDAAKLAYGARPDARRQTSDARRQTSRTTARTTAARADACTTSTEEIDDAPVTNILGVLRVRGVETGGDGRGESGKGNVSGVGDCGGGGGEEAEGGGGGGGGGDGGGGGGGVGGGVEFGCAPSANGAGLKSGYTASWLGSYLWRRQESEAHATQPETLQIIPPPPEPKALDLVSQLREVVRAVAQGTGFVGLHIPSPPPPSSGFGESDAGELVDIVAGGEGGRQRRGGSKSCQVQRERAADPTTLAAGWLWKQDSDLIRRWRRRWFVLEVTTSDIASTGEEGGGGGGGGGGGAPPGGQDTGDVKCVLRYFRDQFTLRELGWIPVRGCSVNAFSDEMHAVQILKSPQIQ